jgi:ABC-type transport system involved in multi-copper enzyme maturation permease subunit
LQLTGLGLDSTETIQVPRSVIASRFCFFTPAARMYVESMAVIVDPLRKTTAALVAVGKNEDISMSRFSGPLSLDQSLLLILPQIIFLVAVLLLCFAVSYIVFLRREIRSL